MSLRIAMGASLVLATGIAWAAEPTAKPPKWAPYANPTIAAIAKVARRPLGESYVSKLGPTHVILVVQRPKPEFEVNWGSNRFRLLNTIDSNTAMPTTIGYTLGWASQTTYLLGPAAIGALLGGLTVDAKLESLSEQNKAAAERDTHDVMQRLSTFDPTPLLLDGLREGATRVPFPLTPIEVVDGDAPAVLPADSVLVLNVQPYLTVERDRFAVRVIGMLFHRQLGPDLVRYARKGQRLPTEWDKHALARYFLDSDASVLLTPLVKDDSSRAALMAEAKRLYPLGDLVGARLNEAINNRQTYEREAKRPEWTNRHLAFINTPRLAALPDKQLHEAYAKAVRDAVGKLFEDLARLTPAKDERVFTVIKAYEPKAKAETEDQPAPTVEPAR